MLPASVGIGGLCNGHRPSERFLRGAFMSGSDWTPIPTPF